jgi:LysM repeat protein
MRAIRRFLASLAGWQLFIAAFAAVIGPGTCLLAAVAFLSTLGAAPAPTETLSPTRTPVPEVAPPEATPSPAVTILPSISPTPDPISTPALTATDSPGQSTAVAQAVENCTQPEGWALYTVQMGDTFYDLRWRVDTPIDELMRANCLESDLIFEGQKLYLPFLPEPVPPRAWEPAGSAPVQTSGGNPGAGSTKPFVFHARTAMRIEFYAQTLANLGVGIGYADFLAAVGPGAPRPSGYDFLAGIPAGQSLEGYLYPGIYEFPAGTTPYDIRDRLLAAFDANVPASVRVGANGFTFHEIVTLASIIQKETSHTEQHPIVASVFYNLMNAGHKLNSWATAQYAAGRPGLWFPYVTDAVLNLDSPYNTHLYDGLPPGPIGNPLASAILGAANPAQTDYFFFRASCDGSGEVFARTFEEHLANGGCNN